MEFLRSIGNTEQSERNRSNHIKFNHVSTSGYVFRNWTHTRRWYINFHTWFGLCFGMRFQQVIRSNGDPKRARIFYGIRHTQNKYFNRFSIFQNHVDYFRRSSGLWNIPNIFGSNAISLSHFFFSVIKVIYKRIKYIWLRQAMCDVLNEQRYTSEHNRSRAIKSGKYTIARNSM